MTLFMCWSVALDRVQISVPTVCPNRPVMIADDALVHLLASLNMHDLTSLVWQHLPGRVAVMYGMSICCKTHKAASDKRITGLC